MSVTGILDAAVVACAVAHLVSVAFLAFDISGAPGAARVPVSVLAAMAFVSGAGVALLVNGTWTNVIAVTVAGCAAAMFTARVSKGLRPAGALAWSSFLAMGLALSVWGLRFLASQHLSPTTLALMWAAVGVAAFTLPSSVLQAFEGWEILLRRQWRRPREPLTSWRPCDTPPKVSIHVPTHAEPPELVIATLERLAALDYPDFEVLVIDNNTTDPSLWRPVESYCAQLGPRFRFFHVEGITGAKAGALNWASPRTNPKAELVGVVDADYLASKDWLAHTVGFFDDARVGFVQCPHAYRDYEESRFGRMANAEYSVFFATSMVSLSEHGAGITVGTMSLIRREALETVGGWAEWCLTEDSELSIRMHAAGYTSVYLSEPYGRGLIPETFAGYKKQRFRWTYGPVQELRRHLPLFQPWRRTPSELSRRQRVHHANHGLDIAMIGLRAMVVPLAAGAMASMVWHREIVHMPVALWIASTIILVSSIWMRWLVYHHALGATLREALGGTAAYFALSHVIAVASLTALAGRPVPWQRTDKFRPTARKNATLAATWVESLLAIGCLGVAAAGIALLPHGGIALSLSLALAWQGATYAASPVVAYLAEKDVRKLANPGALAHPADTAPAHELQRARTGD